MTNPSRLDRLLEAIKRNFYFQMLAIPFLVFCLVNTLQHFPVPETVRLALRSWCTLIAVLVIALMHRSQPAYSAHFWLRKALTVAWIAPLGFMLFPGKPLINVPLGICITVACLGFLSAPRPDPRSRRLPTTRDFAKVVLDPNDPDAIDNLLDGFADELGITRDKPPTQDEAPDNET